jgi:putative acetyltransferase
MEIIIRQCEKTDIKSVQQLYEQPSSFPSTTELPYRTTDKWLKQFEDRPDNFYSLVAELDGQVVGEIGMLSFTAPRRKHAATLGMTVSEKFQGKGIGSKLLTAMIDLANNWLNIHRLELEVFTDNLAAIALYEKQGFVLEGTAKAFAYRNGGYVDAHLMAKVDIELN